MLLGPRARCSSIISVTEVDYIEGYLAYENLMSWIDSDGRYSLIALTLCRHFAPLTCACRIHEQDEYPLICRRFKREHLLLPIPRRAGTRLHRTLRPASLLHYRETIENRRLRSSYWELPRPEDTQLLHSGPLYSKVPATLQSCTVSEPGGPVACWAPTCISLCNFKNIRLVRTENEWAILYRTRRLKSARFLALESIDGLVAAIREEQVRPTRADIAWLYARLGPTSPHLFRRRAQELACQKTRSTPRAY